MAFCLVAESVELHLGWQQVDTGKVKLISSMHVLEGVKAVSSALVCLTSVTWRMNCCGAAQAVALYR